MKKNIIKLRIAVCEVREQDPPVPQTDSRRYTDTGRIGDADPAVVLAAGMQAVQNTQKLSFLLLIHLLRYRNTVLEREIPPGKADRQQNGHDEAYDCKNLHNGYLKTSNADLVKAQKPVESRIDSTVLDHPRERKFHREENTENAAQIYHRDCGNTKFPDKPDILLQKSQDTEKETAPEHCHQEGKKAQSHLFLL